VHILNFFAPPFGLPIPLSGLSDVARILPDFLEGYPEIDSVLSHSALARIILHTVPTKKKKLQHKSLLSFINNSL
jgi:transposase-like protein